MGYKSNICIVMSGPSDAIQNLDKFCCNNCMAHKMKDFTAPHIGSQYTPQYACSVTSTCKLYKYESSSRTDLIYFTQLCDNFPEINLYYYETGSDLSITAACQEDGVVCRYHLHDDTGIRKYRIPTKYPLIMFLLAQSYLNVDDFEELVEAYKTANATKQLKMTDSMVGNTALRPNCVYKLSDYSVRKMFLTESPEALGEYMKTTGDKLAPSSFISALLRDDSFRVIEMIYKAKILPNDCPRSMNPMMFAIMMDKYDEFQLLRMQHPEWQLQLDVQGWGVLHYCLYSNNDDLFDQIYEDLSKFNINMHKLTNKIDVKAKCFIRN